MLKLHDLAISEKKNLAGLWAGEKFFGRSDFQKKNF